MKRFLKYIAILLVLCLGVAVFLYKDRIKLLISVGKNYSQLDKNLATDNDIATSKTLNTMNYKDVVYKNSNGIPLTLDIYSPKKEPSKGSPVIIYVHGGSWAYGDKSIPEALSPILDAFLQQGYTVISTSYELMRTTVNFDKQASDVKDTIRWVYKNKHKYNFNTDDIGIIGLSSGAHLSMLAAYSSEDEFKGDISLSDYPSKVRYVIDFSGPTDMDTLDMSKATWDLKKVLNVTKNKEVILNKFSPINYVSSSIPKTLIIHGKKDEVVPYKNALLLYDKCKEAGADVELLSLENSAHDLASITKENILALGMKVITFISD